MEKLMQFKVEEKIKDQLDEIFAKDGMTAQQGLKTLAYKIAGMGVSPLSFRISALDMAVDDVRNGRVKTFENVKSLMEELDED